jgi:hypothetical protein
VSGKPTEKIPPSALMALTPSGAPIVTSSLTLANLLAKGKRVTHADLARLLATIGALYTAFRNVPWALAQVPYRKKLRQLLRKVPVLHKFRNRNIFLDYPQVIWHQIAVPGLVFIRELRLS